MIDSVKPSLGPRRTFSVSGSLIVLVCHPFELIISASDEPCNKSTVSPRIIALVSLSTSDVFSMLFEMITWF